MSKETIFAFAIGLVLGAGVIGAYFFPEQVAQQVVQQVAGSPAGSTYSNAKVAAINLNPQDITSTSTSMYNGDASDRIVTDAFVSCSNLTNMISSTGGVATFNWYAATSSAAAPTASVQDKALAAMNVTVATSSRDGYTATTTYTIPFARRWNTGTYMVFQTNATSAAAQCVVGVHYLAS